ncbi:MAG TPA: DNA polymerase III subunit epsilon [Alphaproteobacteria bacterium]|nr:DNA polymerase III subunit epsilon [Alphaproteobacteria bacterium]
MREIVLDTETTGFDPLTGDRLVEICCVELVNHVPTGRTYHQYINPERDVPAEAVAVHGLTTERLASEPVFAAVAGAFLEFIGEDSTLVIHNAEFDIKFLNAELGRLGFPPIAWSRVTDTLKIARQRFPGAPASLDALCKRFGIDNTGRTLHGALLDSELLAEVWLELCGGRQPGLVFALDGGRAGPGGLRAAVERPIRPPRPHAPSPEELAAHEAFLKQLKNPLWLAEG